MTHKEHGNKVLREITGTHEGHGESHKTLHEIEGGEHRSHHDSIRTHERKRM